MNGLRLARAASVVAGLAIAAVVPSSASAATSTCTIASNPNTATRKLASFDGAATYDSSSHTLSITLHNTSKRGVMTALAFAGGGSSTSGKTIKYMDGDVAGTRRDEDAFDDLCYKAKKKCKPFGAYAAGVALRGHWTARPGRTNGVNEGQSRTFVFDVSAADASSLDVMDVLGTSGDLSLVAAFKDVKRGKGDRVGATLTLVPPVSQGAEVPATPANPLDPDTGSPSDPDDTGAVIPPDTTGTPEVPAAVPLPPAAYSGLAMMGLLAVAKYRRRGAALLA
jgi:hypothetical protein